MNRYAHKFHLQTIQQVGQLYQIILKKNSISSGNDKGILW